MSENKDRLLRIWEVIGHEKKNIPAIIPISRSSFLAGIKKGKFPKPLKLGERTVCWRESEILAIIGAARVK
jgi:prophage regulatory protein